MGLPNTLLQLTEREKMLVVFLRQLGWGDVKITVQKGQPMVVSQTISNYKLGQETQEGEE